MPTPTGGCAGPADAQLAVSRITPFVVHLARLLTALDRGRDLPMPERREYALSFFIDTFGTARTCDYQMRKFGLDRGVGGGVVIGSPDDIRQFAASRLPAAVSAVLSVGEAIFSAGECRPTEWLYDRLPRTAVLHILNAAEMLAEAEAITGGGPGIPSPGTADQPPGEGPLNGPGERGRFWWDGKSVDLSGAPLRYRLCAALWDADTSRPRGERTQDEVLVELYPDDDAPEGKLKDVVKNLKRDFERAGIPLTVRLRGGRVWLEERPG